MLCAHQAYDTSCICCNNLKLQNRLARDLLTADIRTPVDTMMKDLDWTRLNLRWEQQLLNFKLSNVSNKLCLLIFHLDLLLLVQLIQNVLGSQSHNNLVIPPWRTISGKRTFHYRAAVLWNKLPPILCVSLESLSVNELKNAIAPWTFCANQFLCTNFVQSDIIYLIFDFCKSS